MEKSTLTIDPSILTPMEQELILGKSVIDSKKAENNHSKPDHTKKGIEDFVTNYKPESLKFGN